MLALPPEWHRSSRYVHELVASGFPELAQWPYNRFHGVRQVAWRASRLFSISRIQRKVRLHLVSRSAAG
jgi:hypothetical protein